MFKLLNNVSHKKQSKQSHFSFEGSLLRTSGAIHCGCTLEKRIMASLQKSKKCFVELRESEIAYGSFPRPSA